MTTPASNGATLSGASHGFVWSTGTNVTQYYLWLGSTAGSDSYYFGSQGTNTSGTIGGLPSDGSTVYVRLGGGCQGCGMASVTLSQGIEETIRSQVPEISKVVDVTDHAEGSNPYYEQAKK